MDTSTWRRMIVEQMAIYGEALSDIVSSTISENEMDVEFPTGYGRVHGIPFTIWTINRVYFPTEYDGAEDVASVSRNPDGKPTEHV